jgi:hypothetical protein
MNFGLGSLIYSTMDLDLSSVSLQGQNTSEVTGGER